MKLSYIALLLILQIQLCAQENLTLEKAISIGLENNFDIKIADKYIDIAENNNTWAKAGKTPTVDLRGSFNNTFTNDNNPASFLQGTFYNGGLGANVDANWVVYNGGRFRLNKEQLMTAIDQQKLNKASNIHNLLRTIYQQYYNIIYQQEQLDVLAQVFALSRDRLSYEETKRDYGTSNSYNLIQFQSAVLADTNAIVSQTQRIEVAQRNLYKTLQIIGTTSYTFGERLSIELEQIDATKLKESMSEENYTIKSLNMISDLNRLNTNIAESARRPTISVGGSLGYAQNGFQFFADNPNTGEPFPFFFSNRATGGVNANLVYNLYDGGVRKTDIQNARIQEEIDQLSIEEAKAELGNQLDILIDNYNNQVELLNLTDRQIQLANQNLLITEERFKSGRVTSLDYRNVQNQFVNAAYSKVGAIYNLLITKSEIDYLVGKYK